MQSCFLLKMIISILCSDSSALQSSLFISLPPTFPYCFLPLSSKHISVSHLEGKTKPTKKTLTPSLLPGTAFLPCFLSKLLEWCIPTCWLQCLISCLNLQLTVTWFLVATISLKLCSNIATIFFQQNRLDSFHSLFSLTSLQHPTISTTFLIFSHIFDHFFLELLSLLFLCSPLTCSSLKREALIIWNCSLYVVREHPNLPSYLWWQRYNLSTGKGQL